MLSSSFEMKNACSLLSAPGSLAQSFVERLLNIHQLKQFHQQLKCTLSLKHEPQPLDFIDAALEGMNISLNFDDAELNHIPASGPVIVIANHPFGAIEGLVLAKLMLTVRPDVRLLVNKILQQVDELHPLFFFVDPYQRAKSFQANIAATRSTLQWLKQGGALGLFPAGEVAHWSWPTKSVSEPQWLPSLVSFVRATQATVVPLYVSGANSWLFQAMGVIHPQLRTLLLPRELWRQRGQTLQLTLGQAIPYAQVETFADADQQLAYYRFRQQALRHRTSTEKEALTRGQRLSALAPSHGITQLKHDIRQLPKEQQLIQQGRFQVYYAQAQDIPHVLEEIGRLRELSFRQVGEGTGLALDLDRFDQHYWHLFIWDQEENELVGAYRMGPTDSIEHHQGLNGFYSRGLFGWGDSFLQLTQPGLEMGRSFIQPAYQKNFYAMQLLWRGIGQFLVNFPHYRFLFGPVSISSAYRLISRQLMAAFLKQHYLDEQRSPLIDPRHGFELNDIKHLGPLLPHMDALTAVIADIEPQLKGIPILLKHYVRLGGRIAGFNVDPQFNHALDALIVVDLLAANMKAVQSYMGKEGYQHYLARQQSKLELPV